MILDLLMRFQLEQLYNLVPEMSQYVNYYILKNTAFLNDDIFFGSQGSSSYKSFYSIGRKESILANFKVENWSYVTVKPFVQSPLNDLDPFNFVSD